MTGTNSFHLFGSPLEEADFVELQRSRGISRAIAERALLRNVDDYTAREMFGHVKDRLDESFAGKAIPYFHPGRPDRIRDWRIRRRDPPQEIRNGAAVVKDKYLSTPGADNNFYFLPQCDPKWLKDTTMPVVIVEGEFKTLSTDTLAWYGLGDAAERPHWMSIGISGVWNWKGKIGNPMDGRGDRHKVKGPIADFDDITWKKRLITILFDANVDRDPSVRNARRQLRAELRRRGAKVLYAEIPVQLGLNGIDDVHGQLGAERALEIIAGAYDPRQRKNSDIGREPIRLSEDYYPLEAPIPCYDEDSGKLLNVVPTIGDTLLVQHRFASNCGEKLHVFVDGAYRDHGAEVVRTRGQQLMRQWNAEAQWRKKLAEEIAEWVILPSARLWERPPMERINLLNGVFNLQTGKLEEHSPAWLSPVQLPIVYDPQALCPTWDTFSKAILPADCHRAELIFQLAALLMVPYTGAQKSVLFQGPRGTGKSRCLFALRSFLGAVNVSSVSLHSLEENRFASAYLYGKLANICPDIPARRLQTTSTFKAITGEDYIMGEYKHGSQFQFQPFARLLFSANSPPQSDDTSDAFLNRWWVIFCSRRFQGTKKEIAAATLDGRLREPRELSGVFNRAMHWLPQILRKNSIFEPKSMRKAHQEFYETIDPFSIWASEYVVKDSEAFWPCDWTRNSYFKFRREHQLVAVTMTAFGHDFKRIMRVGEPKQRTFEGRLRWCYEGIRLKTKDEFAK